MLVRDVRTDIIFILMYANINLTLAFTARTWTSASSGVLWFSLFTWSLVVEYQSFWYKFWKDRYGSFLSMTQSISVYVFSRIFFLGELRSTTHGQKHCCLFHRACSAAMPFSERTNNSIRAHSHIADSQSHIRIIQIQITKPLVYSSYLRREDVKWNHCSQLNQSLHVSSQICWL